MIDNRLINWRDGYGIDIAMISDQERNQFYDRIMKGEVTGKNCIEIGYGIGTLSMIALTNGAKRIRAFEYDYSRYKIGQYIIKRLGLEDKIFLYNKRFEASDIEPDDELIFHEILDQDAWGEGVYTQFFYDLPMLPSKINGEFYQKEISLEQYNSIKEMVNIDNMWQEFYQNIRKPDWPVQVDNYYDLPEDIQQICTNQFHWEHGDLKFTPGVEFAMPYQEVVDDLIDSYNKHRQTERQIITNIDIGNLTHSDYSEIIKKQENRLISYSFDTDKMLFSIQKRNKSIEYYEIKKELTSLDLRIDHEEIKDKISLIVPSFEIEHKGHKLRLNSDRSLSHWFTPTHGAIIYHPHVSVMIRTIFQTGESTYHANI